MNLVVAVDKNWAIGNKGDLLAHVRKDLKNFAKLTTGNVVILGSKTLSTFPGGRVLKNRTNVVLSTRPDFSPDGAIMARNIDELKEIVSKYDNVFVIGGATIYRELLPLVDTCYVTKFDRSFEADAFFDNLDESPDWKMVYRSAVNYSDPETDDVKDLEYYFTKYRRI